MHSTRTSSERRRGLRARPVAAPPPGARTLPLPPRARACRRVVGSLASGRAPARAARSPTATRTPASPLRAAVNNFPFLSVHARPLPRPPLRAQRWRSVQAALRNSPPPPPPPPPSLRHLVRAARRAAWRAPVRPPAPPRGAHFFMFVDPLFPQSHLKSRVRPTSIFGSSSARHSARRAALRVPLPPLPPLPPRTPDP